MIELEHSPLGGSGAHRFMSCAASFLMQREQIENGQYEDVPSEFAALGTAAHEIAAEAIASVTEPYEFLGEARGGYKVGWPDGIKLDAIQAYFNECMSILDQRTVPGTVLIEKTIKLPDIHPLFKGTVDFGWWAPDQGLWLRDYKNGEGIGVSAVNNRQLLYYASLMILSDDALVGNAPRDLPVNLGIVQPNFYGVFAEPDVWITTLGYVLSWYRDELLPRMDALYIRRDPLTDDDYVPGDHCQFCPVLLSCVKMQRAYRTMLDASEDFITVLTNAELDELYAQKEYARRFMKVLETTVHHRMVTGGKIPSAKLVEKITYRVWKPGGVAAIQAAFGDKAYTPAEPISPAAAEKLSSQGKALALEWAYKPESAGLVVAPLSDPRPEAKTRGNATVFEAHAQAAMEDF